MQNTTKRAKIIFALVAVFFVLLSVLFYRFLVYGSEWVTYTFNNHVYDSGVLSVAGTIYDRDGEILATSIDGDRVYNEDLSVRLSTLHVVGDSSNYIATSVQSLYQSSLIGYNFVDGLYTTITTDDGSDITLTIDAQVSAAAYEALNGEKGTIAVYNYETGEVICMVSSPTFDPEDKPSSAISENLNGVYDGVYLNRSISGVYTPGSTFKIVTGICAIENFEDIYERTFTCTGECVTSNGSVICNSVHGTLTFERALQVSCNSVFAQLAIELGADLLTQTVRDLGLGTSISVSKAETVKSTFDLSEAVDIDLGWAGIGQYTTLVNPTQMLMLMGAIANSGVAITPYTVESSAELIDYTGVVSSNISLSAETADLMAEMLRSNVSEYYGDSRFPDLEMCGKTGTAEVMDDDPHAWFVGFSVKEDFPYAIVVVVENGGSGSSVAIPIANTVMQAVLDELG